MIDILGGLALRVLQIYAWTLGLGLVVLGVIMLVEGTVDFFVADTRGRPPALRRLR